MQNDDMEKKPFHATFAEKIIERLKAGTAPWQTPWTPGAAVMVPHNPVSGTMYKGVNRLQLTLADFSDPRWMTYKQALDAGYQVREGSKATPVVFYQWTREQMKTDERGEPILGEDGKPEKVSILLRRPIFRLAHVFNAEQIEGVPPLSLTSTQYEWEPKEKAESILKASGATIRHDQSNRAFYRIASDEIHLPPKVNFDEPGKYYATALHELGHWTGHSSRLNREFGPFGSEPYAREELRAEIASWMLGEELGIGHDPDQHAAYVQSWIEILEKDPMEIMRACRDAEQVKDYVLGLERERTNEISESIVAVTTSKNIRIEKDARISETQEHMEKVWLSVPYKEKELAKRFGAKWDRMEKSWYVFKGADMSSLSAWLPQKTPQEMPALSPQEEFRDRLREAGLDLNSALPIMDGTLHRVPIIGRPNARDGVYKGYSDGLPAGWFQNHVSGETGTWKYSGHKLSSEDLAKLREISLQNKAQKQKERKEEYERAAKRCYAVWMNARIATDDHPYLERKGVSAFGLKMDEHGNLLVPGYNVEGKIQTLQFITPGDSGKRSVKRFERGTTKNGAFHLIDPEGIFGNGPILIAEGYATAASLHQAMGLPVVCAFDSSNLVHVAAALREKYPENEICIMADNDQRLEARGLINVGLEKARIAAERVGGKVFSPDFTEEEQAKGLTDFNDLHRVQGLGGIQKRLGNLLRPLYWGKGKEPSEIKKSMEMAI